MGHCPAGRGKARKAVAGTWAVWSRGVGNASKIDLLALACAGAGQGQNAYCLFGLQLWAATLMSSGGLPTTRPPI